MSSTPKDWLRQWQELRTLVRHRLVQSKDLAQNWVRDAIAGEAVDAAAYALSALAWVQVRGGDPESALRSLQGVLKLAPERLSEEARACSYTTLAAVCLQHLDTRLALRYARRAVTLAERGRDRRLLLDCMAMLGCIEANLWYGFAGRTSKELLDRLDARDDKSLRMIALADVAYVKFGSGHYASGQKYAQEAYTVALALEDRTSMASSISAYALNCAGKGNLDKAMDALCRSHEHALKLAEGSLFAGVHLDYAEVYLTAGLREQALESAQIAFREGVENKQWNVAALAMRFAKRATTTSHDVRLDVDQASRDLVLRSIAQRLPATVKIFPLH